MTFNIILSQGRVADKTPGAIKGAALTADALMAHFDAKLTTIGSPSPSKKDDWTESLPQAKATLNGLASAVSETLETKKFPIMVANTCPASIATLPIVAAKHPDAVVLWVDAHGDFNTPDTTDSGYLGGMVLAAACGLWQSGHGAGLKSDQIIVLGGRDIDESEAALMQKANVEIIPPAQANPQNILRAIAGRKVWIHIDWDSIEPGFVSAAYKVPDGLLPEQLKQILDVLPVEQVLGLELAEFEASDDDTLNSEAVATIIETISPLLSKITTA